VLQNAWQEHPGRFHPGGPAARVLPSTVYINKPIDAKLDDVQPQGDFTTAIATSALIA
jgi:hypothetical protein